MTRKKNIYNLSLEEENLAGGKINNKRNKLLMFLF